MHTVHSGSTLSPRSRWRTPIFIGVGLLCAWLANAQPAAPASGVKAWWEHAVIYEIYPRSFQDSNADGVGDLNGITQRLGYLESLGVDAIWIAPFYPSPQVDFGYDISDYEAIDPQFGTMADFDRLSREAQRHHIRLILDMVLNHTSDRHPWFIDAARSRTSQHHDFYAWNNGKSGDAGKRQPPNNWVSLFGGSAWEYVPAVDQFYYHMFYRQQPDLNWRNPKVEQAMFDAMRFWLNRGVAGFRLDAITTLFEDSKLRDAPVLGGKTALGDPAVSDVYTNNLPEVHDVIRRMRSMVDSYPGERLLIGETYVSRTADLDPWYGGSRHDELQLPMDTLLGMGNKLDARLFRQHLVEARTQLDHSPPLYVFDNHDNIRSWDRYGDGVHNAEISRIVATILLTSNAAALIYQGEEIGQITATPTRVQDVRDPIGRTGWPQEKGRDGERTPMQWDTSNRQAGFSANEHTWLPVTANYTTVNVQTESADPASLLSWYRKLIALRRTNPALLLGHTAMLDPDNADVLTYLRVTGAGRAVLVSLNMSAQSQTITPDLQRVTDLEGKAIEIQGSHLQTLLSSPGTLPSVELHVPVRLPPYAAWVAEVQSGAFANNDSSKAQQACVALSGLRLPASAIGLPTTGAAVERASIVAADAADNANGEYCAVTGFISPVSPTAPAIEFQVNLPSTWNGKAVQMGGGGYDGTLVTATGRAALEPADVPTPLKQGFVTLGSDGGHKGGPGFDGRFGLNDEALLNYGKESIKKTHDAAIFIIRRRYSRAPGRFYFIGGSQGGHEALDAAARYPADYDGVVSNFPAYNVTLLHLASLNVAKAVYGNNGAGWLSPSKTKLLTDAVYAACDTVALDGVEDGIISNVAGCNAAFNIQTVKAKLACPAGQDTDSCLTPAQIAAVERITSPYHPGFPIAGMSEFPHWPLLEGALFKVSNFGIRPAPANPPAQTDALLYDAGAATSKYIITRDPSLDALTFDPNTSAALRTRTQAVAKIMDVTDVDLGVFRRKGGKIILVHGTVDDFISPHNTVAYYNRQRELQGANELDSFLRFYLVPGLGHGMGPFNAKYDGLRVLQEWVEKGHAPGTLTAVDENPATKGRTRPMCVFPAWPRYDGRGPADTASSYHCVER